MDKTIFLLGNINSRQMVKRRVADILIEELARQGITHGFTLSGGGIMYLIDALGRGPLAYVCCHHEQAAAIAAQAYAMHHGQLGLCLITTGPGGTNALTGCAAAYMDSTPVLFLSGQVKTADFATKRRVRQFGAQENDIVSMAKPVSKYAVLVEKPKDALYELQKAVFLATHGRKGPVWVDVPLDVQAAEIEESGLRRFDPVAERAYGLGPDIKACSEPDWQQLTQGLQLTLNSLATARRPLILVGHGMASSPARAQLPTLAHRLGIPVMATWRALGLMDSDDPLFFGSPGLQAVRSANLIIQAADFVLVLGSRLDNMITAFSESRFAMRAKKIIVDIDANEISKLDMPDATPVVCDAALFVAKLGNSLPEHATRDISPWLNFCQEIKKRFPLLEEKQDKALKAVNLYRAVQAISAACEQEDVIVVSSTSRCNTAGHIAFTHKAGRMPISSMGLGSMGFALPSVIGAWFASGGRRIIALEGDGSLQLNIQELQTIKHHNINVKLFIFSNGGYAAISAMQDRNFGGFHVGSDEASGLSLPDLKLVAAAYGLAYTRISFDHEIDDGVRQTMDSERPTICEIIGDIHFDEIPKCISSVNAEGKRVSATLENPYPFLSDDEMNAIYDQLR